MRILGISTLTVGLLFYASFARAQDEEADSIEDGETLEEESVAESADEATAASDDLPEIDKIRTPDSPAFVILGASPTEIQKPTTPKELAVSLSAFVNEDNDLAIPDNIAIEVAPYWWGNRESLSYDDFLATDASQLWRNLSLSLGTAGVEGSDERNLGVGFRTQIGWGTTELASCKKLDEGLVALAGATAFGFTPEEVAAMDASLSHETRIKIMNIVLEAKVEPEEDKVPPIKEKLATFFPDDAELDMKLSVLRNGDPPTSEFQEAAADLQGRLPDDRDLAARIETVRIVRVEKTAQSDTLDAALDAVRARLANPLHALALSKIDVGRKNIATVTGKTSVAEKLDEARTACAAAATARSGVVSFAGALAWRFPSATGEQGDLVSQAYWLTYAHTIKKTTTLLALARLQFSEALVGWDGNLDFGGRAITSRNRFAASLEVVGRKQVKGEAASDADLLLKIAALAEVEVKDGTWLSISFGKEFSAVDEGALFSLANLSWGFGDPKIAAPK